MTLGKHEAHMLKLRYSNTSNFEVSAKSRGEEYGSGACVMWGSRPPPQLARQSSRSGSPESRHQRIHAPAGFSPPPPESRRCRRRLLAGEGAKCRILAAAAAGILPWPVSCRRRIPTARAPASVSPGWSAAALHSAAPIQLICLLRAYCFWGRMCFVCVWKGQRPSIEVILI